MTDTTIARRARMPSLLRAALRGGAFAAIAAFAVLPLSGGDAGAQAPNLRGQQIVLYTFGGTQLEITRELVIGPFERETGARVVVDDSCCQRMAATLEAGQFLGDVIVGLDRGGMLAQDQRGWFVRDPRLVEIAARRDVPEAYRSPAMLIFHFYSYIMAASRPDAPMPRTWAEFWDVERFPGPRGLNRISPTAQLEMALLADGVAPADLYPLDVDRAFRKLDELRRRTRLVFNASGAEQINNLATGEIAYGVAYSNRVFLAAEDRIRLGFTYAQGLLVGNGGAIPRGARNLDGAIAFLDYHMRPDVLARFAERTGMAPSYAASAELVAADRRPRLPTSPGNIEQQYRLNEDFWRDNRMSVGERWVRWLAQ